MLLVRKPGRPLSSCPHPRDIQCSCATSITVAIPMSKDCPCPSEAPKLGQETPVPKSCCTPSAGTPTGDLPSPTRNEYRVTKGFTRPDSSRKQSYDPANFARMSLDTMNVVTPSQNGPVGFGNGFAPQNMYAQSPAGFAPPSNGFPHPYAPPPPPPPPPGYAPPLNGYAQPPAGYVQPPYPAAPAGSSAPSMGFGQQFDPSFYNTAPQYPTQYNTYNNMPSGPSPYQQMPAPPNGFVPEKFQHFDDMVHVNASMPMMNNMSNGTPQPLTNKGLPNGGVEGNTFDDVFASQRDGPSPTSASEMSEPPEPRSCCASKATPKVLKQEDSATPVIKGSITPPDMQESYSHNTIAPAILDMQPAPQDQPQLSVLLNQHQQQFPSAAALPYGSFENPAQPSTWRHNMQLNYTSEAQNTAAPSPFVVPMAQNHVCCCGDTCSCIGCVSHPFNKTIYDYAQNAFPPQETGTNDGAQGVASDSQNAFDTGDAEILSSPALTPTASRANSEDQNLNTSNYFWVKLPMNGPCQGLEGMCDCGPGCECDGCEIHDPKRIGR